MQRDDYALFDCYEYIQFEFEFGLLTNLNSLSVSGWRIVMTERISPYKHIALLERRVPREMAARCREGQLALDLKR